MRNVTVTLIETLGAQYNEKVNRFVCEQYHRDSETQKCRITLKDADERDVTHCIRSAIHELNLCAEDVFNYMMVAPYVSVRCTVDAIVEFNSNVYRELLVNVASTEVVLIKEGMEIEYSGKTNHVSLVKKGRGKNRPIIGGFINGIFRDGERKFSVLVQGEEWAASVNQFIQKKYNDTHIVDDVWMNSLMESILYRRLIDEIAGAVLNECEPDNYVKYLCMIDYGSEIFEAVSDIGKAVYSDYGQSIGHTVRRFSVKDKLEADNKLKAVIKAHPHLSIVVDNDISKDKSSPVKSTKASTQVFTEWGSF